MFQLAVDAFSSLFLLYGIKTTHNNTNVFVFFLSSFRDNGPEGMEPDGIIEVSPLYL